MAFLAVVLNNEFFSSASSFNRNDFTLEDEPAESIDPLLDEAVESKCFAPSNPFCGIRNDFLYLFFEF